MYDDEKEDKNPFSFEEIFESAALYIIGIAAVAAAVVTFVVMAYKL